MTKNKHTLDGHVLFIIVLVIATTSCLTVTQYLQMKTNTNMYNFLTWDIFLAWTPLFLSIAITKFFNNDRTMLNKLLIIFLSGAWIFFLPNAAYLFTEIIHSFRYFERQGEEIFWDKMWFWYSLTIAFVTAIIGLLLSTYSIYQMSKIVNRIFNKYVSSLFVVFVMLLSSIGVYIGRFNRWNSWDIIDQPKIIMKDILNDWFKEGSILLEFVTLMFVIQLFCYLVFSAAIRNKNNVRNNEIIHSSR
ncbi:DUF1361 domain-containing protein [Paenibacillus sp. L3-i20]|uniref:DUF1361 domain-containing protein n=1 Tax=Paenibacillus sp. L3-i20 TaxID=2905833 RepID=UPI001EDD7504|nr:DUF1361 domain-containing protein [Paenibacillus sp. L3-i20]GKU79217.1 hypothetical protein L3i20_v236140 [Paenibacillus sp. L3-i20]